MGIEQYELGPGQWEQIRMLLLGKVSDLGRTGSDNSLLVNGCLWALRSTALWCDLPERYGNWKTVHRHFNCWRHFYRLKALPKR